MEKKPGLNLLISLGEALGINSQSKIAEDNARAKEEVESVLSQFVVKDTSGESGVDYHRPRPTSTMPSNLELQVSQPAVMHESPFDYRGRTRYLGNRTNK
jgi:hypothetical protein